MSQFLPEPLPSAQQTADFKTTADTPSSDGEVALMQRVLAAAARNPNLIPEDFMAYLIDYVQTSRLSIPIGQVFGFRQQTDIRGRVDSAGNIASGTGFTVSKLGTGNYEITFDSALTAVPAIAGAVDDNSAGTFAFKVANASTTLFQFLTYDMAGTLTDAGFYFTASPFV